MNETRDSNQILIRLADIRQTVRRRLLAFGIFAVLSGGAAAVLGILLLDWSLWLPPALRIVGSVLFVGGFIGATYHWIIRPLRAPLGIDEIAGTLEEHFPELRDRLSSTVNFIQQSNEGVSSELMREVIARTDEVIDGVPLENALAGGPVAVRGVTCALSCAVFLVAVFLASEWMSLGVDRYVRPWGGSEWPTSVEIRPLTDKLVAGMGESVILRMQVVRGLEDSLRGVAKLVGPEGRETVLAMNRDAEGHYWTTVDAITQKMAYWFEAGDDNTQRTPGVIRVIRRPEVVQALVTIEPPVYASDRGSHVADLAEGAVEVTEGCGVTVRLQANKSLGVDDSDAKQGLRFEDGSLVPMRFEDGELVGTFVAAGEMRFRPELIDEHGFENRHSGKYVIIAIPDRVPTVTLYHPRSTIDVTPDAVVHVSASVTDDFGIVDVRLVPDPTRFENSLPVSFDRVLDARAGRSDVTVQAKLDWELKSLALSEGDTVSYSVTATDNRSLGERVGQVGSSPQMLLRVISATEMETHAREDMLALEARVRALALEQEYVHDRTMSLQRESDSESGLTQLEKELSVALAGDEARLGRMTTKIAASMGEIGEQLLRNRVGDDETRDRVREMAASLMQIAGGAIKAARGSLAEVPQKIGRDAQHASLTDAGASQTQTLDELYGLLRDMSQWGSFQGVVTRTRQLLDRQTELRNETLKLGRKMLGKSVDALSHDEQAKLKRAMREQSQLGDDVAQHLANLKAMRDRVRAKDTAGADAIENALRAGHARDIKRRLASATKAVGQNRTAAAAIEQRAVVEALRKMVGALRERESRELAELRKRLESAEQRVAELLADQVEVRDATHETTLIAANPEDIASLAMSQGVAAQNAALLGQELLEVDRAIPTARLVTRAVVPMRTAERLLGEATADAAVASQDEAIALLEEALGDLEALARQAAEQEMRRSLAQIEEDLNAILTVQRGVSDGAKELVAVVGKKGRIRRAQSREASRLGREQSQARLMVDEVSSDFEKVPVYRWAMERIGVWMDSSSAALDARRLNDDLVTNTARIVAELEKLVGALAETRKLPMGTEFAEAERQGGGGASQSGDTKPVPAIAELLVLRALQVDINERTKAFREGYDPVSATEEQLRALMTIGEDQAEVARLTKRVTEQSKEH
jgi:hypothetical protein